MEASREESKLALKNFKEVGWELICAQGFMEYYISKNAGIALKLFNFGMSKFSSNSLFLSQYIKFINLLNDENNTRQLFETILTKSSEIDNPSLIWDLFIDFESVFGDLDSIKRIELRKKEALGLSSHESSFQNLIKRSKYLGFYYLFIFIFYLIFFNFFFYLNISFLFYFKYFIIFIFFIFQYLFFILFYFIFIYF